MPFDICPACKTSRTVKAVIEGKETDILFEIGYPKSGFKMLFRVCEQCGAVRGEKREIPKEEG